MNKIALSLALLIGLSATGISLAQESRDRPDNKATDSFVYTAALAVPLHKAIEKHRIEMAARTASHIVSVEIDYDRDVPEPSSIPGMPSRGPDLSDPFFRYDVGPFTGLVVDTHQILISDKCLGEFSKSGAGGSVLQITVTLPNGDRWPARVIGRHQQIDLALLEIDCDCIEECAVLSPIKFSQAPKGLTTGQQITVVGRGQNPLSTLVNDGVVSAINRENGRAFQLDARIGNSTLGAPVVNRAGELVGMVTLHSHQTFGQASGVSYAAYIQEVGDAYALLKKGQFIKVPPKPFMGVQAELRTDLPGLKVTQVVENTGAERAGLRTGDVILKVNGKAMDKVEDLFDIIQKAKIGDVLKTTILRVNAKGDEEEVVIKITLGVRK